MRQRTTTFAVLGSGLALVLAACSGGTENADGTGVTDESGSTELVVASPLEPPSYDYTQTDALDAQVLLSLNVVEPLIEQLEDGTFEPLLAESYEVSDDGLEYTFTMREATFHDGSELTAADVVYSLDLNKAAAEQDGC